MDHIKSIALKNLQNAEALQLFADISKLLPIALAKLLEVELPYNLFSKGQNDLSLIYKTATASPITSQLIQLDERRGNGYLGFYYISLGNSYSFDAVKKKHAEQLLDNLEIYGSGINQMNYPKQTAVLSSLYEDWTTKPEQIAAVAALGLLEWVTEIKTANDAFNVLYLDRVKQTGSTADVEKFKDKRQAVTQLWYDLRDALVARYKSKQLDKADTTDYTSLFNNINAIIDKYITILNDRKAKAAKAKGGGGQ